MSIADHIVSYYVNVLYHVYCFVYTLNHPGKTQLDHSLLYVDALLDSVCCCLTRLVLGRQSTHVYSQQKGTTTNQSAYTAEVQLGESLNCVGVTYRNMMRGYL